MDTTYEAVGREDRHDAKESRIRLINDSCVEEAEANRVYAVVGKHNSLREAGRTAGVADSNGCVTIILRLVSRAVLGVIHEVIPAHNICLAVGNVASHSEVKSKSLNGRKRRTCRLYYYMLLLDIG